jgi:hypothetical protein
MKAGFGTSCVIQLRAIPESFPKANVVFNLFGQISLGLFGLLEVARATKIPPLIEWSLKLYIRLFTLFAFFQNTENVT